MTAEPSDGGSQGSGSPEETLAEALEKARSGPALLRTVCAGLGEEDASRKPGVGKLSAREHVSHLIEMERDIFRHRFERTLNEERPQLSRVAMDHEVEEDPFPGRSFDDLIEDWAQAREQTVALVDGVPREQWERLADQPEVGSITFLDLVVQWARHDDDHLRQLEIITLNSRERNL